MPWKGDAARLREAGVPVLAPRAWGKLRRAVFERDGYACQLRIPGVCTGKAEHAHHTLGRAVTGDDPDYVVAACKACNLHVGEPLKGDDPPLEPMRLWW